MRELAVDGAFDLVTNLWTSFGYYDGATNEWDVRTYAPVELRQLLAWAGFEQVSLYAGLDGSELDHGSTRLVAVAAP